MYSDVGGVLLKAVTDSFRYRKISRSEISVSSHEGALSSSSPQDVTTSSSSSNWRNGYDQVIKSSYGNSWSFYGWLKFQPWNGGSRSPIVKYTICMSLYPGVLSRSADTNGSKKVVRNALDTHEGVLERNL